MSDQTIVCASCDGLGWLTCPCDTTDDCTCPLWECPDCAGLAGINDQLEETRGAHHDGDYLQR